MTEDKFYDYLVIGGEHHGVVFNGPYTRILEVPSNHQPLAKFYAREQPAEVTQRKVEPHPVIEHTRSDGNHFFIATNEDTAEWDIEAEIRKYNPRPVN
ncbi:hypothetical protein [Pectobacterium aroidearum]|uniref:hypothetical protein n=1 Tax=Pectobacterium aroidearum TaxID=1201031 RepID=UPI002114A4FD|nr:hypothetical protein [Pectobacterium aroidearum]UUE44939.1 hypothetical protein L0Y28_21005 [Pectobacterium aroidearum]UUE49158.1 hypothetical protein L0Y23_20885 [Pectobacterium aroidearum]UUE53362.1 hypothetical protein L0Y30_21005 [Pectobacterium aroidearum]UUE61773.1 hypothetical protein L0Y29_21005 [Pectobacterium aroidearum]UUE65997.1 hypothetical protein L0Y22_21000 [Pectobacterium aroidearum]